MKIENQVCTIEQSIKMKNLGITQDSSFGYVAYKADNVLRLYCKGHEVFKTKHNQSDIFIFEKYAAFTVAELGVMLPTAYDTMRTTESKGEMWKGYDDNGDDFPSKEQYKTEAEARAAMLIRLLEKGAVSAEEVNNSLVA